MLEVMVRRGPDRRVVNRSGAVTLGHGLLATTPEAANESQPFIGQRTGNVIVADIRLDNRAELRSKVGHDGRPLHLMGDAELALAAYDKWQSDFARHLLGDFAIAIWDANRHRLVLARDHFGVRPLQYFLSDDLLVFASDGRAIRSLAEVPRGLNRDRLIDFFVPRLETCDVTGTFFEGINRLTPAHTLEVEPSRSVEREYWRLEEPEPLVLGSDAEYIEAHDAVFGEAVRCRQRSRDDHAVMLSGGIDSAAIAVYETDHEGAGRACSAISTDGADLESRLVKRTVDRRGLKLHTVTPDQVDTLCGSFADRVRDLESPFDAAMTLPAAVCATAAVNGIRSLSAGVFANEVAEPALGDILRVQIGQRRFREAIQQFDPNGKLGRDRNPTQIVKSTIAAGISSCRAGRFLESRRDDRWRAAQTAMLRDTHLDLGGDDLARVEERLSRSQVPRFDGDGPGSARRRLFAGHYASAGLERYDRVGAAHSVEIRSPFMDKGVVEFWLSLPAGQLIRRGWPKVLLRLACDGRLPADVVWNTANEHLGWVYTLSTATKSPIRIGRATMDDDPLLGIIGQAGARIADVGLACDADVKDFELAAMMLWVDHKEKLPSRL